MSFIRKLQRPAYLALLLPQLFLGGCASPPAEEGVRAALVALAEAIEDRDTGNVMGALHPEFENTGRGGQLDRAEARRMLMAVFYRHQKITVNLANIRVTPDGMNQDSATAKFNALVTGGRGGLLPETAQLYRVESEWQRDGDWKLVALDAKRALDQ